MMQVRIGKAVTLRPEPAVGQLLARDCPTQVSDRGIGSDLDGGPRRSAAGNNPITENVSVFEILVPVEQKLRRKHSIR